MKEIKFILALAVIALIFIFLGFNIFKPEVTKYSNEIEPGTQEEYDFILDNLVGGGPQKEGIPSIDNPKYININESSLNEGDKVFGVDYKGFVVAYPQDILYWHEIVNEEVEGEKISITYCPLTESVIGYKGKELGVSGRLYNSNLVMYDRETESRVPQILGKAIEGSIKGESLDTFQVYVTTWKEWKSKYPETLVLSRDTSFERDYDRNPYPGYDQILRVWFPLTAESDELKTKNIVYGIEYKNEFVAIRKEGFKEKYPEGLNVKVGGKEIHVSYNEELNTFQVDDSEIKSFEVFWFAWYANHPTTKLIQ